MRALGSLGSLLILGLIVITPGLITGMLEKIETSKSGIISREELESIENTTVFYSPFKDNNEDVDRDVYSPYVSEYSSMFLQRGGDYYNMEDYVIWDVDGYLDHFIFDIPSFFMLQIHNA